MLSLFICNNINANIIIQTTSIIFNSRPYYKGRLSLHFLQTKAKYFNSRPYIRGDYKDIAKATGLTISTHAPT